MSRTLAALVLCAACGGSGRAPAGDTPPSTEEPRAVADAAPAADDGAKELHAALAAAAQDPEALWKLVNPRRGLEVVADDGRNTFGCAAAELAGAVPPFHADQRWECTPDLQRCMSRSSEHGDTLYYFRGGALDTIADSGVIMVDDREVEGILAGERGPCFTEAYGSSDAIRATLTSALAAKPMAHFQWSLVDPARGLVLLDKDGGNRVVCDEGDFYDQAAYDLLDQWTCTADLSRCTSSDDTGWGYTFYLRDGAVDLIVSHDSPAWENARAKEVAAAERGACAFATRLAEAPADLWVYTHPTWFQGGGEGDEPTPRSKLPKRVKREHLCGEKAAKRAAELLALDDSDGDHEATCAVAPVSCSLYTPSDSRGDEIRLIAGKNGAPWVVALFGEDTHEWPDPEKELATFLKKSAKKKCK